MASKPVAAPTLADMDALLAFLPVLYAKGFQPVAAQLGGEEIEPGVFHAVFPEYEPAVTQFFELAAQACWQDVGDPSKPVVRLVRNRRRVARASLAEIQTLLTWCVRGERFADGHWAAVIEDGTIRAILERLQQIRADVHP